MWFRVLGPLEVIEAGQPLSLGAPRTRTVLGVLLTRHDQLVSVEQLIDELWPQAPPPEARALVHGYVSRLRRALKGGSVAHAPAARLITRKPGYLLDIGGDELDVRSFEALIAKARTARDAGQLENCVALYTQAQKHWAGEPFADVPVTPTIAATAMALTELRLAALAEQYEAGLQCGHDADLIPELAEHVAAHPLREQLVAQLMLAMYRTGRKADALGAYGQTRQRLADELGVDPGPHLRQLEVAILRDDPALVSPAPGDFPRPAQLPADVSTFTGRTEELAALLATRSDTLEIKLIDGMAGVGKTALALHAAHRLAGRFPHGQLFLDLHGFTEDVEPIDPADALDRMLRAIGVPAAQIPEHLDERAAMFRDRLSGRRVLILLDNAAAKEQIGPLLPGTPQCLVIVTSRRRLTGLAATPISLDVLPLTEAATLFTTVAGRGDDSGEQVHEIVRLCGRLPLAIRIAASRLRSRPAWNLADLIDRLRDQPGLAALESGQSSITAALHVSHEQLEPSQQSLFGLLGLLPGVDVDAYAAAALAGTSPALADGMLEHFVDCHLLQTHQSRRYRFHDLIRGYAAGLARAEPEDTCRAASARLLDYYTHMASIAADELFAHDARHRPRIPASASAIPSLTGTEQAAAWLDTERANLLAAAAYAVQHGWPEHTTNLSRILHQYLDSRSHFAQAHTLHRSALSAAEALGDRAAAARILSNLSASWWRFGRYEEALDDLSRALTLVREVADQGGEANVLTNLGIVLCRVGRYNKSREHLERALALYFAQEDRSGAARALNNLVMVHQRQGRYDQALEIARSALRLYVSIDNPVGTACALGNLGEALLSTGRHDQALQHFQRSRELFAENGNSAGEADALSGMATAQSRLGRHEEAIAHHERALAMCREARGRNSEPEILNRLGRSLSAAGRAHEALTHHYRALGLAGSAGDRYQEARTHEGLAMAHSGLGQLEPAGRHRRQAQELHAELGVAVVIQPRLLSSKGLH